MAQILKFVYALILFLSLFFILINGDRIPCATDADCPPKILPIIHKCINNFCKLKLYN
ncbi:Nodule Cysteine-Rich (NCR) secreted peptide [Medicago truncatula]|uniref:Nodule Cysteine-Rich (NCR) secreted peptide n=2 Tax=Medicago truncatula TaxID=3880 RepID=A0A072TZS7_MEDTR|nr:Nodule Cysteine-Rich (NCR) secreted peptide [Medicago truncatula]